MLLSEYEVKRIRYLKAACLLPTVVYFFFRSITQLICLIIRLKFVHNRVKREGVTRFTLIHRVKG